MEVMIEPLLVSKHLCNFADVLKYPPGIAVHRIQTAKTRSVRKSAKGGNSSHFSALWA